MKNVKGITLVALVITIVVLLILSAVTISLTLGERGIFNLAQNAGSESKKAEATEKVNLKITQAQMKSYVEKQRLPSLQELADMFNIDNDFEYVHIDKKELAAVVEPFSIGNSSSIFVKLEDYTYEFEIDNLLRLASIDGVRLATVPEDTNEYVKKSDYDALVARIDALDANYNYQMTETQLGSDTGKKTIPINTTGYKIIHIVTTYLKSDGTTVIGSAVVPVGILKPNSLCADGTGNSSVTWLVEPTSVTLNSAFNGGNDLSGSAVTYVYGIK